jgi:hypothetical protein
MRRNPLIGSNSVVDCIFFETVHPLDGSTYETEESRGKGHPGCDPWRGQGDPNFSMLTKNMLCV